MKNNKGVSIIMLVITIVLMILIASFAVFYSNNIAPEARLAAQYTSLKEVKSACDRAILEMELYPDLYDEFYFFGHNIHQLDEIVIDGEVLTEDELMKRCQTDGFGKRTFIISDDKSAESQRKLEHLELSSINETYVVDLDYGYYYLLDGVYDNNNKAICELSDMARAYSAMTNGTSVTPNYFTTTRPIVSTKPILSSKI